MILEYIDAKGYSHTAVLRNDDDALKNELVYAKSLGATTVINPETGERYAL